MASGHKVNMQKSSIFFGKGSTEENKEQLKAVIGINSEALSEKYLGMPIAVGQSKNGTFRYLRDRVWEKVKGWMQKLLSAASKEVLIKSVAQAIPVFSMSCFKLPRGLCEHLNKLIRQFWWGSKEGKRKPHWVSWKVMSQPKFMGGLGFRDFKLFNLALLAKHSWRLLKNPQSLCANILKAIYYPNGTILSAELGTKPSQVWRAILEGRDVLNQGLIRRIGNGNTTLIWEHNWLPNEVMMRPIAYLTVDPPILVSELIDHTSAAWRDNLLQQAFLVPDTNTIRSIPLSIGNMEDT